MYFHCRFCILLFIASLMWCFCIYVLQIHVGKSFQHVFLRGAKFPSETIRKTIFCSPAKLCLWNTTLDSSKAGVSQTEWIYDRDAAQQPLLGSNRSEHGSHFSAFEPFFKCFFTSQMGLVIFLPLLRTTYFRWDQPPWSWSSSHCWQWWFSVWRVNSRRQSQSLTVREKRARWNWIRIKRLIKLAKLRNAIVCS